MSDFEYLADEIYEKIEEIGAWNLGLGEKMEDIGRGMVDIECVKIEEEVCDDGEIVFTKHLNIQWQCDNSPVVKFFSEDVEVVDEVSENCTTLPDGRIIKVDSWCPLDDGSYSDSDGNEYLEQNDYIEEMASDFEEPDDDDEDDDDF